MYQQPQVPTYQQPQVHTYQQPQVPTYQPQPMQSQPIQQQATEPKKDTVEFLKENWYWIVPIAFVVLLVILDHFNIVKINFNFRNSDNTSNTTGAPNTEATPTGAPINTNPVLRRYPTAARLFEDDNTDKYIREKIKDKDSVITILYFKKVSDEKSLLPFGDFLIISEFNQKTKTSKMLEFNYITDGYKDNEINKLNNNQLQYYKDNINDIQRLVRPFDIAKGIDDGSGFYFVL